MVLVITTFKVHFTRSFGHGIYFTKIRKIINNYIYSVMSLFCTLGPSAAEFCLK